ncbi:MAG: hypothetical protein M3N43_05700, partial [Actinomycetota bacterium]|nr:hypothetical protein [Actinomycetota bacterium]
MQVESDPLRPGKRELEAIPPCPWAEADQLDEAQVKEIFRNADKLREWLLETRAHQRECRVCQARQAVIDRHAAEFKGPWWSRGLERIVMWVSIQPGWARPMWYGAILFVGLTMLRAIPWILGGPDLKGLQELGVALALGAGLGSALGLVCGNVYRYLHPRAHTWGRPGPILAGVALAGSGFVAIGAVLAIYPDTS